MPVVTRIQGSASQTKFFVVLFGLCGLLFIPLWFGGGWGGLMFVCSTAVSFWLSFVVARDTSVVLTAAGVEYVFPKRRVVPWSAVASVEFKEGSTLFRFRDRGAVGLQRHPQRAIRVALARWRPELLTVSKELR